MNGARGDLPVGVASASVMRGTSVRAGVERYVKEFAEWFPEMDAENILRWYPSGLMGWRTHTEYRGS